MNSQVETSELLKTNEVLLYTVKTQSVLDHPVTRNIQTRVLCSDLGTLHSQ